MLKKATLLFFLVAIPAVADNNWYVISTDNTYVYALSVQERQWPRIHTFDCWWDIVNCRLHPPVIVRQAPAKR